MQQKQQRQEQAAAAAATACRCRASAPAAAGTAAAQQQQQKQRHPRIAVMVLLALVLLASAGAAAVDAAAPGCRGKIPGCATNQCVNRLVNGASTLICPDPGCDGPMYTLTPDQTRCDCVPGAYAECNTTNPCTCQPCTTPGYYCPGGRIPSAPLQPCGVGLTTPAGVVATSARQCVLLPGYGWLSTTAAAPSLCRIGTYSPGGVTGRISCTRCPSGLTTVGVGAPSKDYCVGPPGAYVTGSGRGASCPVGTFQPNYTSSNIAACQACPVGVTTSASRTKAASGCSVMLPGYGQLTPACGSDACQAAATAGLCAVGAYNEGGLGSSACKACPNGMTTRLAGSATVNDCLVPPGYGLDPATQQMVPCVGGFNPGWNRASCTSCGVGVTSINNRTSGADCYVLAGQGLQASTGGSAATRVALTCPVGSFGMANDTPADAARPCDTCPRFMTTAGDGATGRSSCRPQPGYTLGVTALGINGSVACAVGTYKPLLGNDACTLCPGNSTTAGVGSTDASQCSLCPSGTGSAAATPPLACALCPANTFNNGSSAQCQPCPPATRSLAGADACSSACPTGTYRVSTGDCLSCPANTTTPGPGAESPANCTLCAAGTGGWTAAPSCSACALNTYSNGNSTTCTACPANTNTTATGSAFVSSCVAAPGYSTGPTACPIGTYKSSVGNTSCTACPNNTTTLVVGATSVLQCSVCVAGFGAYTASPTPRCSACSLGFYGVGSVTTCTACPANTNTTSTGSTSVSSCAAAAGYSTGPIACAIGTYKPTVGNTSCTACPSNTNTLAVGATSLSQCSVCASGFGSWNATSCSACPIGSFSLGASTTCTSCPNNTTTLVAAATNQSQCSVCVAGFGAYTASPTPSCSACALNTYGVGSVTTCTACPANTLTTATTSTSVAACLPGPGYTGTPGNATACPIGTFKSTTGTAACTACPNNTTTLVTAATNQSQCSVCVAGFGAYTASPTPSCSACSLGFYGVGSVTTCTACPANTNTTATASTAFSACVAAPGYSTGPIACAIGTYKPTVGNTSCTACPSNTNTLAVGATSLSQCSVCASGFGSWNATSCSACPIGSFSLGASTTCTSCPNNTTTLVAAATNQSQCSVCVAGFGAYTASPTPSCSACALNTYGVGSVTTCTACPANTLTTATTSTSVAACLPGPGYTGTPGNATACPIGTFKSTTGTAACTACPNNTTTLVTAATNQSQCSVCVAGFGAYTASPTPSCSACSLGFYGVGSVTTCTACPANTNTTATASTAFSACVAAPGYSTGPIACAIGTYKPTVGNTSCTACPSNTNTLAVGATSLSQCSVCAAGYGSWSSGPACTLCAANTFSPGNSTSCLACFEGQTSAAGAAVCVDVTPTPSTCTPRPTTSTVAIDCPSNSLQSWPPVQPNNIASLPGGCISPGNNGNCQGAVGQFDRGTNLVSVPDAASPNGARCVCPNAAVTGAVPRRNPATGSISCNNTAIFLADNPATPSSGAGVWQDDLTAAQQTCDSPQSCWDMCFFCNGYPRYQATARSGQRLGALRAANLTTCTGVDCFTGAAVNQTLTFAQACAQYAAAASPTSNPLLTPTGTATSPYRAQNTALYRYSAQPTFPAPLPAGTAVNRGQRPMRRFALV